MRTENQIKRKLNELNMLKKTIESKVSALTEAGLDKTEEMKSLTLQAEQLETSVTLLEWVLDEPVGKYHA